MNEKREVILPSDFSGEKGKIVCYRISSYLELLYIDIRSRRIPEVQIQAYKGEAVMTVNFSFLGKCEVLLKNGGGTYVDTGEYSIDYGTASREADADMNLLAVDVSRWLQVLCSKRDAVETNRVYYSGSQIQIARKTMDILTEDLSKRYSAATLAKHFGISETSLKNYFQGVYGRGYSELLNEIRMKKAAELILKNSMKISEISDAVGFATQSRFAKAFKNYYGAAPLEYKRKHNLNKDSRQMELSDNK